MGLCLSSQQFLKTRKRNGFKDHMIDSLFMDWLGTIVVFGRRERMGESDRVRGI